MSLFGPSWFTSKGNGIGNLKTCDHVASSKSMQVFDMDVSVGWSTSPVYIPIGHTSSWGGGQLDDSETKPYAFNRNLFPGVLTRASMYISTNSLSLPFKVWLARDGPTRGGGGGTPVNQQLMFDVLQNTDPLYINKLQFPLGSAENDDASVQLFSGHTYGYVLETLNDAVPTGNIQFSIWTSIYYGGAGS